IECLVDDAGTLEPCCERAAARCASDLGKLEDARVKFARYVSHRRCQTVPVADILGADGLGYQAIVESCEGNDPRAAVDTLEGLAGCIAERSVAATACTTGTSELPRAAEALACTG